MSDNAQYPSKDTLKHMTASSIYYPLPTKAIFYFIYVYCKTQLSLLHTTLFVSAVNIMSDESKSLLSYASMNFSYFFKYKCNNLLQ